MHALFGVFPPNKVSGEILSFPKERSNCSWEPYQHHGSSCTLYKSCCLPICVFRPVIIIIKLLLLIMIINNSALTNFLGKIREKRRDKGRYPIRYVLLLPYDQQLVTHLSHILMHPFWTISYFEQFHMVTHHFTKTYALLEGLGQNPAANSHRPTSLLAAIGRRLLLLLSLALVQQMGETLAEEAGITFSPPANGNTLQMHHNEWEHDPNPLPGPAQASLEGNRPAHGHSAFCHLDPET